MQGGVIMFRMILSVLFTISLLCADNLIVNPGFDEDPWYTGWAIEGDSGAGSIGYMADTTEFLSPPQCGLIWASVGWSPPPYIKLYQEIPQVKNCTCSVYFQNLFESYGMGSNNSTIELKINGQWTSMWSCTYFSNPYWTHFYAVLDSTQVVSGIRFTIDADCGVHGGGAYGRFRIDNVYISGEIVEVKENSGQIPRVSRIAPNPFRDKLFIDVNYPVKVSHWFAKIFDPAGRLINVLNVVPPTQQTSWDGTDFNGNKVPCGLYIIQLEVPFEKEPIGVHKVIKY